MSLILILAAVVLALVVIIAGRGRARRQAWYLAAAASVIAVGVLVERESVGRASELADELPVRAASTDGYVTSDACESCHRGEHRAWVNSYHKKMGRVATPEVIVGDFDGVELSSRGRTYRLERRGDEFWVQLPSPDEDIRLIRAEGLNAFNEAPNPEMVWKRIVMATGEHWMQTYWVALDDDRSLWQLPWCYLVDTGEWVPREDIFLHPDSWKLRRMPALWNFTCIRCHSSGGKPKFEPRSALLQSQVADFGIGCESCHGPAAEHVEANQSVMRRLRMLLSDEPDDTIANPPRMDHERATMVCGQCHNFFSYLNERGYRAEGDLFRPGEDLTLTRQLSIPGGMTWKDGTVRVGGVLTYNSLIDSTCYQRGEISCGSCHNEHQSDPVDMLGVGKDGNDACLPCHAKYGDNISSHTHHQPGSQGSQCMNCHMPYSTTVLFHRSRSHRIDSPNASMSAVGDRPNACNLCHLDQTLEWTARALTDWYGQPIVEMTEDDREVALGALWMLQGGTFQRTVVAASAGWGPAQEASGTEWMVPYLAELLQGQNSATRRVAYLSLRTLPGYEDFEYGFLDTEEHRREATERALTAWRPPRDGRDRSSVLLADDGTVLQDEFARLLGGRDAAEPESPFWKSESTPDWAGEGAMRVEVRRWK